MAALDFPASPSVNDTYTANGKEWIWNGTSWINNGAPATGPTGPAGASRIYTADKTLSRGQVLPITLSTPISSGAPVVYVLKEVPSSQLTNNNWRVDTSATDYTYLDSAYSVTLTPNKSTKTLTLGSGSFAASDVGKRITGNGGEVILLSTSGRYYPTVSDFTDNSSISSGSWKMYSLQWDLTNGLKTPGLETEVAATTGEIFDTSSYEDNLKDIVFKPDGTELYFTGSQDDRVHQVSLSTAWDLSTATYTGNSGTLGQENNPSNISFKSDGTKFYLSGTSQQTLYQYSLSTAWDITTASYDNVSLYVGTLSTVEWKPDGTEIFILSLEVLRAYPLSTAWDFSTIGAFTSSLSVSNTVAARFADNGSKIVLGVDDPSNDVRVYSLSTAYDLSTASLTYDFALLSGDAIEGTGGIAIQPNLNKLFTASSSTNYIEEWQLYTPSVYTGYAAAVTNSDGQINTEYWTSLYTTSANPIFATDAGTVYYALSTDNHATWKINILTNGERNIVRNNSGTWEYNSNTTYASTTWTAATVNTELGALEQAITDVSTNRMLDTDLNNSTEANITLGDTFDLAVIFNRDTSASTQPSFLNMSVSYVSNSYFTDFATSTDYYRVRFIGSDYIEIVMDTSQGNGNYKISII